MSKLDLFDLTKKFREKGILITFSGPFTHKIIEELGKAIRGHLEDEKLKASDTMRVFSVFVEQAQNVKNYVTTAFKDCPDQVLLTTGMVTIAKAGVDYSVSSGNMIKKQDAQKLIDWLEYLNTLDRKELRALYKEQARKPMPEGALGAGLGLIDMARTAKAPLQHSIREVDAEFSFYSLTVLV
ncbi:SiaB family protein kinase [Dethiosulfatarculus sandiegensis]|uniref:Uncharacterized protein n=1 Tax=Dethiosulfatarculus sandiegensis TaxID=1429043 RepID=A0A0D2JUA2_9BACT|nr:SiaB family protein kinase [Dethiosulfatarculus sandiegensis]KIX13045.1 hypothetical protein X474_15890 [Dethiosulfatarculus sandiegensis]